MGDWVVEGRRDLLEQPRMLDEMWNMVVGEYIDEGAFRDVYKNRLNPDTVIKVQKLENDHFDNIMEWKLWESVQYAPKYNKWFAPCLFISPNGRILIQRKTEPLRKADFPKQVPSFLWDLKIDNWGWFRDRPVCHDYGNFNLVRDSDWKLRKARIL